MRAVEARMQSMTVGASATAATLPQSFSAANHSVSSQDSKGYGSFQEQLAAQTTANPDSPQDSQQSDATTGLPANADPHDAKPTDNPQPSAYAMPINPQPLLANPAGYRWATLPLNTVTASPGQAIQGFITGKTVLQSSANKPSSKQEKATTNPPAPDTNPADLTTLPTSTGSQSSGTAEPASPAIASSLATSPKIEISDVSSGSAGSTDARVQHRAQQTSDGNTDNVAFAMRLNSQANSSAATPQPGQDTATIQGVAAEARASAAVAMQPNAAERNASNSNEAVVAIAQTQSENKQEAPQVDKTAEAKPVAHDPAEQTAGPARYLRVQMAGDGNQQVELRLIEHSGGVNVSVRSTDPALSRSLQDGIPELTTRLQADRFHTEVWLPKSAESHSSNSGDSYSSGGRGSGGYGNQQQSGYRKNQSKPEWVDELERLRTNTTGRRTN